MTTSEAMDEVIRDWLNRPAEPPQTIIRPTLNLLGIADHFPIRPDVFLLPEPTWPISVMS